MNLYPYDENTRATLWAIDRAREAIEAQKRRLNEAERQRNATARAMEAAQ